jgi:hypothetical protein
MSLESRLTKLEDSIPSGYRTFDGDGNIVIDSPLPAAKWYTAALDLLQHGSAEEKDILKEQLNRSRRARDGGHLFELVLTCTQFACGTKDGAAVIIDLDDEPELREAAQARARGETTEHNALLDRLMPYDLQQLASSVR